MHDPEMHDPELMALSLGWTVLSDGWVRMPKGDVLSPDKVESWARVAMAARRFEAEEEERLAESRRLTQDLNLLQIAWEDWQRLPIGLQRELLAQAQRRREGAACARLVEITDNVLRPSQQNQPSRLDVLQKAREDQKCLLCGRWLNRYQNGDRKPSQNWVRRDCQYCPPADATDDCRSKHNRLKKERQKERKRLKAQLAP